MRRNFHDDVIHARIPHVRKRLLQLDNIRRRIVDLERLILNHDLNRPDESDLIPCCTKNSARDIARRRLAIRSRNAYDAHFFCGIIVKKRHDAIQCLAKILHGKKRHARGKLDLFWVAGRDDCDGARRSRLWNKLVPIDVLAWNGDKKRPLLHLSRIVCNRGDIYIITKHLCTFYQSGKFAKFLHPNASDFSSLRLAVPQGRIRKERFSYPKHLLIFMCKIGFLRNLHLKLFLSNALDTLRIF